MKAKKEFKIGHACSFLVLTLCVSVLALALINHFFFSYPIYGEKPAEGIQIAYGEITGRHYHHGWQVCVKNITFDMGDVAPRVGDNIIIAYEWELMLVEDCVQDLTKSYKPRYIWLPVVKAWRLLR